MKRQNFFLRLTFFLILLISSYSSNAQIEIGEYKNKFVLKDFYYPEPPLFGKKHLLVIVNENIKNVVLMAGNMGAWAGLNALEDKISADKGTLFYYKDIIGEEKIRIYAAEPDYVETNWVVTIPVSKVCGKPDKSISFFFRSRDEAKNFAENMYFLVEDMYSKNPKIAMNDSIAKADSIQFLNEVAKYREMIEKPATTEEQRKYIVQANAMNERKNYTSAIDYYNKAVKINSVTYPTAYYNLALLYAQITNFKLAIINMNKYLLLVPNAEDARKAKDKIYEWEINTKF